MIWGGGDYCCLCENLLLCWLAELNFCWDLINNSGYFWDCNLRFWYYSGWRTKDRAKGNAPSCGNDRSCSKVAASQIRWCTIFSNRRGKIATRKTKKLRYSSGRKVSLQWDAVANRFDKITLCTKQECYWNYCICCCCLWSSCDLHSASIIWAVIRCKDDFWTASCWILNIHYAITRFLSLGIVLTFPLSNWRFGFIHI